jgi:NAD(P)H-dependent flavin oxidoreductase YrpB (nitropropane dioxygenase family)
MLKTRITELLGIAHPIQCGTMQWLSRAELVAAVVNAGGLACLSAATFDGPKALVEEIQKTRDLTDRPFGVNVSLFPALIARPPEEFIAAVVQSGVKILETAGRNPEPYRKTIEDAGLIHIHKCARLRDAVKVDRMGVDIVSVVGMECGGHPGMEGVCSLVLIALAAKALDAPLIAGGGFSDGRSLVAALALGAEAVNMGTRFIATRECPVHEAFKKRIVQAAATDTELVMTSLGNPARVLRNRWAEKVLEMEAQGATLDELAPLLDGRISKAGWVQGNLEEGLYPVGQVIGCIHDIPSVADLIQRIMEEAVEVQTRLEGFSLV